MPSQVGRTPSMGGEAARVADEALRLLRRVLAERDAAGGRGCLVRARVRAAVVLAGAGLASGAAVGGRVPSGGRRIGIIKY